MSERGVEDAGALVQARPGDRLLVAGNAAGEQDFRVLAQTAVSIQTSRRREGFKTSQDRMLFGRFPDLHPGCRSRAVVTLVVAAENFLIEFQPVLKSLAGAAHPHDRLAPPDILLDAFQLFAGAGQP